jgi:hypothetical protein
MKPKELVTAEEAEKIAVDAYIYGYPLVLMYITKKVTTNVPKAERENAPVNQIAHLRAFPDYTFTDVVSPNADTLYSIAWLDLQSEPIVLSVPDVDKRYYLMPLLDAWTNVFASPGTRTTGNRKGDFSVVGPDWKGKLPVGVHEIKSPTNMVWLIGRTQTDGKQDYANVHAIQDQYLLTPLSAWGKLYTPPANVPVEAEIDVKTPPVDQVARMDAATFFPRLNALMKDNPPAAADKNALKRFAAIGVEPGKLFDLASQDPAFARGLAQAVSTAQAKIVAEAGKPHGKIVNGWQVMKNTGSYGTDYLWRAVVALVGLGANLPEDAVYPHATADAAGQPLTGAHRYVVRFPNGQLPPVGAFWSLTMYNARQAFAQNPLNRYAIGDRDNLRFNDDGSLTIFIQHDSPGKEKESNWLPAPADSFNVLMRLYWPKREALDGAWKMPLIEQRVR